MHNLEPNLANHTWGQPRTTWISKIPNILETSSISTNHITEFTKYKRDKLNACTYRGELSKGSDHIPFLVTNINVLVHATPFNTILKSWRLNLLHPQSITERIYCTSKYKNYAESNLQAFHLFTLSISHISLICF